MGAGDVATPALNKQDPFFCTQAAAVAACAGMGGAQKGAAAVWRAARRQELRET